MKRLLLIAVLLGSAYSAQAQIDLGLKGGINAAQLSDLRNSESYLGYHFGGFFNVKVAKFGVQVDLLYSRMGADSDTRDVRLDYLMVPAVAKLYLVAGLNLQAGMYASILAGSDLGEEPFLSADGLTQLSPADVESQMEELDLGMAIGAGWDIPLVPIIVDLRYTFGFGETIGTEQVSENWKNRTLMVSVGFSFL